MAHWLQIHLTPYCWGWMTSGQPSLVGRTAVFSMDIQLSGIPRLCQGHGVVCEDRVQSGCQRDGGPEQIPFVIYMYTSWVEVTYIALVHFLGDKLENG